MGLDDNLAANCVLHTYSEMLHPQEFLRGPFDPPKKGAALLFNAAPSWMDAFRRYFLLYRQLLLFIETIYRRGISPFDHVDLFNTLGIVTTQMSSIFQDLIYSGV